jgi:ribonuclease BN (tRNA processing enzyme)
MALLFLETKQNALPGALGKQRQRTSPLHSLRPLEPGREFHIGGTRIKTFPLNHPGGALAYRLERAGRVVVFASDHEQHESPDRSLADFAQEADVLYMDAQYLDDEYQGRAGIRGERPTPRRGWGHSTVEGCIVTAAAAGVRRILTAGVYGWLRRGRRHEGDGTRPELV